MSSEENLSVAVIGGGAAGFFAAIHAKKNYPEATVVLIEKTGKLLAKVRVSGGGRCNVTNGSSSIRELSRAYPRGSKFMKQALKAFSTTETKEWFQSRGVELKTESDNRVFPVSNNSETIINCLMNEINRLGVSIKMNCGIKKIEPSSSKWKLISKDAYFQYDKVIIATGGSPKLSGFTWLYDLGHAIEEPMPSLFTFNMPKEPITKLMGVVAKEASVSIQGSKLKSIGPLLITHWGMSGPSILKLSAFGARDLGELDYNFKIQVNWINVQNNSEVFDMLANISSENPKKYLSNIKPYDLPERLWLYVIQKSSLSSTKMWQDLGKKGINKIVSILTNDIFNVSGKTTFKEEFVTCGGISLSDIDTKTMESKLCPNLYFAGEVLNVDGITGGYNFQAAWTTGFLAGQLS